MLKGKFFRKIAKMTALLLMLLLMLSMTAPGAFALNSQNNKAFNYCGYNVVDSDTIEVYLDKPVSSSVTPVLEQFKIEEVGGSQLDIDSISYVTGDGYSGVPDTQLNNGTQLTIELVDPLTDGANYEVTVSNTVYANNGSNIGSYFKKKNSELIFEYVEDSSTIIVTPRIDNNDTGIPWESNIGFTLDRLVDTTAADYIKNNMRLQKKDGGGVYQDVTKDSTVDANAVTGAECYTARYNRFGSDPYYSNYFFFPMTGNGKTTVSYNLSSGDYRLVIPSFTYNSDSYAGSNVDFTTTSGDVPGKLVAAPTVTQGTANDNQLSVSWSAGTTSPVASDYNVYYSTDKYWNFTQFGGTVSTTSATITGLTNGQSYYVRITPVNSYGEGGFSLANDTAVAP